MHYAVCKATLEAGLHVVCKAPLCFPPSEAEELAALAMEKKRVVNVTYGDFRHQTIQQARQMIKHSELGKIRVINMRFAFGGWRETELYLHVSGAKYKRIAALPKKSVNFMIWKSKN